VWQSQQAGRGHRHESEDDLFSLRWDQPHEAGDYILAR
jgi:hypothetical protein